MSVMGFVTKPCIMCQKTTTLTLDLDKFLAWQDGALVQNVWPEWSPGQRELLITGTHDECWDKMFAEEDE